jgi:endonuclease YncB( thermonuclease family)
MSAIKCDELVLLKSAMCDDGGYGVFSNKGYDATEVIETGVANVLTGVDGNANPHLFTWSDALPNTTWAALSGFAFYYNTSLAPNCVMERDFVRNIFRFRALTRIAKGTELTHRYKSLSWRTCFAKLHQTLTATAATVSPVAAATPAPTPTPTPTLPPLPSQLIHQDDTTPVHSLCGRRFVGKCVKCYDADSTHIVVSWNGAFTRFVCRLSGVDTAEVRTADDDEKTHAIRAREHVRGRILNKLVEVECGQFDKYGRLLVTLFERHAAAGAAAGANPADADVAYDTGTPRRESFQFDDSRNAILIRNGYGYAYDGGKKKPFREWHHTN